MKIFLSYAHDDNAPLIGAIKSFLSMNPDGTQRHEVWIDVSEIKVGDDWRREITNGILQSDIVLAGLSLHSTRNPGVCKDELMISIGVKGGNIKTVLLEPTEVVCPPAALSHIQWLDLSDWKCHSHNGFDNEYFRSKFEQLRTIIETPENYNYDGEINELKYYLNPISSISRIKDLTREKMYGRKWLFNEIEKWDKQNNSRIFWIMAGPGFGKSMFAANLQQLYNANIPAIQFVEWGKPDHCNPQKILCNIAFYLATRYSDYRKFLLSSKRTLEEIHNQEMNEDELFDFLFCESTWLQIDGKRENAWILIDAIDEANDEYDNKIAKTLARHIKRLPKWLKFIITSRNDSKIKIPLDPYRPQVCDLDSVIKEYDKADMLSYLKTELSGYGIKDADYNLLISKSNYVFLYLYLLVQDIKAQRCDLSELNKLPQGLAGYYYSFFQRMFTDNISYYQETVAPVLQVYVASESILKVNELKYLVNLSSESELLRVLSKLEHLFVYNKNETGYDSISFFHNSVENWLTDYSLSGPFFISRDDGIRLVFSSFRNWIQSSNSVLDTFWLQYKHTVKLFIKMIDEVETNELKINRDRVQTILKKLNQQSGLGGKTIYTDYCLSNQIVDYFHETNETNIYTLLIILEEAARDSMIEIGVVSPETRMYEGDDSKPFHGATIVHAINCTAVFGYIARQIAMDKKKYTKSLLNDIKCVVETLAFYDRRVYDVLPTPVPGSLWDYGDFTALELDYSESGNSGYKGVSTLIKEKVKRLYPITSIVNLSDDVVSKRYKEIKTMLFPEIMS